MQFMTTYQQHGRGMNQTFAPDYAKTTTPDAGASEYLKQDCELQLMINRRPQGHG